MWSQKFGFIVGNSFRMTFGVLKKVAPLLELTYIFFLIIALIALSIYWKDLVQFFKVEEIGQDPFLVESLFGTISSAKYFIVDYVIIFVLSLFTIPLCVAIFRAAALGEESDFSALKNLINTRNINFTWAYIKYEGLLILIRTPFIMLSLILTGYIGMSYSGIIYLSHPLTASMAALMIVVYCATEILTIFFTVRWDIVLVKASMDEGTSLQRSFELTRGNWWLIFLSQITIVIGCFIFICIFALISSLLLIPLYFVSAFAAAAVFVPFLIGLLFLTSLPLMIAQTQVYLILTDRVEFKTPEFMDKKGIDAS